MLTPLETVGARARYQILRRKDTQYQIAYDAFMAHLDTCSACNYDHACMTCVTERWTYDHACNCPVDPTTVGNKLREALNVEEERVRKQAIEETME